MEPFISVITVNYNDAQGLRRTLDSVGQQTYERFEHIVIDGASQDDSTRLLETNAHSKLHWISEPDTGIYNAMNKGIDRAGGSFLLFLNSGDALISENSLEEAAGLIDRDIPFNGFDLILDTKEGQQRKSHPEKISLSYLLQRTLFHPSTFIRSDMFKTYGRYNENNTVVSDWEFFLKTIGLNGESFLRIQEPLSLFDMSGSSSKKENNERIQQERAAVIKKYLSAMNNADLDRYVLEQMRNPSKRIKYVARIENGSLIRKVATGVLKLLSAFAPNSKND